MPSIKKPLQDFSSEWSYKILALLITIFLWVFIMGRDDAVETSSLEIVARLPENFRVISIEPNHLEISIRGNPKIARRYFAQKKKLVFDIYNTNSQTLRIPIREEKLDLPFGVEMVEMRPKYFDIKMTARKNNLKSEAP